MKKLFLTLFTALLLLSIVILPVCADEISTEIVYCDVKADDFYTSGNPRYPTASGDLSLFASEYTDAQKAILLRDFIIERLRNMEAYKNKLSLYQDTEYNQDYICVDLSDFSAFTLSYNSENEASTEEILLCVMSDIRQKTPDLFWVGSDYTWWFYNDANKKVIKIGYSLNYPDDIDVSQGLQSVIDAVSSLTAEYNGYVKSITDQIPAAYSDYEKILFTNDYLCVQYQYDGTYNKETSYNAYGFLKTGTGVCQGYSLAFMAIMDRLGIQCDSVISSKMNHMWNLVQVNGKWYHIDVTWNDPTFSDPYKDWYGQAYHKYFLLSSACMQDNKYKNHTGFDVDSYGYQIGNEYDNIGVDLDQSLKSSFVELNGTWYNTGYNNYYTGLYALESSDIVSITNETLKVPMHQIGGWGYYGAYSYLAKYKDMILFNTPVSIYAFDGENFYEIYKPTILNEGEKIYGFDIHGDSMRLQIAKNPNVDGIQNATEVYVPLDSVLDIAIQSYNTTTKLVSVYAPKNVSGILIFASYGENNRLIDCRYVPESLTFGTKNYNAPSGFKTDGAEKIKVMFFDSLPALKPLCKSLEQ